MNSTVIQLTKSLLSAFASSVATKGVPSRCWSCYLQHISNKNMMTEVGDSLRSSFNVTSSTESLLHFASWVSSRCCSCDLQCQLQLEDRTTKLYSTLVLSSICVSLSILRTFFSDFHNNNKFGKFNILLAFMYRV